MRFRRNAAGLIFGFFALAGPIQPLSFAGDDVEIWLEAEDATIGSNWSVVNSSSASGGQYLEPPAGNFFHSPPTDSGSKISFNFQADGGTYLIHGLVKASSGDSDSLWVRANGGSWVKWNLIEHSSSFIWDEVHHQPGSGSPVPTSFNLISGSNTLEIVNREEGTLLDKVYITNTGNDPEFSTQVEPPVDTPAEPQPDALPTGGDVGISLEAEDAVVGYNWSAVTTPSASGGEYLVAPSGNYYDDPPKNAGSMIKFNFQADGGTYLIHGLVKATTGDNDSFWVRANGGSWVKWNLIEKSSSFVWDQVDHQPGSGSPVPASFNLVSGSNTVEFAHREEGAALDKIYLTNTGSTPDAQTPAELPADALYQPGDLISLHFKNGSAKYSYQTMLVSRMFLDHFDGLSYMVVKATEQATPAINNLVEDSKTTDLIWGSPGGSVDTWISARLYLNESDRSVRDKAVRLTAERWQETILAGGHVWVLDRRELGFTAEVLEYLNSVLGVSTGGSVDVMNHGYVGSEFAFPPDYAYLRFVFRDDLFSFYDDEYSARTLFDLQKHPKYGSLWQGAFYSPCTEANLFESFTPCDSQVQGVMILQLLGVQNDEINSWPEFAEYFKND